MDIKENINWIHKEIDKVKDPAFIGALKELLQNRTKANKAYLEAYNLDLDKAEEEIASGYSVSHEEVAKKIEGWKKK